VDAGILHKKVLESLILAGAFDSLGYRRRGLLETYEKVAAPILADRRAEAAGQFSLFGGQGAEHEIDESVLSTEEFEKAALLRHEKEMLGQYVTDHPLLAVREQLDAQTDIEISEIAALGDGDVIAVGGIVTTLTRRYTKKGEAYLLFRLEDLAGGVQIIVFPSLYERAQDVISVDAVIVVRGRVDLRGRELQLVASEVRPLDGAEGNGRPPVDPVTLEVAAQQCSDGLVVRLKEVLAGHPGQLPVVLRLVSNGGGKTLRFGEGYRVDGSVGLLSELRSLLGPEAVR
jgi:DNA polymerase-3 subunit alpha